MILTGVLQGIILWFESLLISCYEYVADTLLDVFRFDLDYFRTNIPIMDTMMEVLWAAGWALLIGNLVFQAMKGMLSGLGFESEPPGILFGRTAIFAFLLAVCPQICAIVMSLTGQVVSLLQIPDAVNIRFLQESDFSFPVAWLLAVIVDVIMVYQILRIFFSIAERYVLIVLLVICAPLVFGIGGSKQTEDIFKGWARLLAGVCGMAVLNMKLRENSLPGIADRLSEEERTARRYLEVCGLEIAAPDYTDNQQLSILYDLLNPRTSRRAKLPLSIFEMVSPVYGLWEEELDRRLEEEMENEDFEEPPPESAAPAQEAGNGKNEGSRHTDHKAKAKKRLKKKKKGRKEKAAELSPLEQGAYTIPDILAPSTVDFTGRDYIVVDGICHTTLYITGYGYKTAVGGGWLNLLVEAGEGVNISFTFSRQPRNRMLSKIAKTTMVNRSRMRDVGDTRQDFEELDSAIESGLFLKAEMNRNGEDFVRFVP